MGIYIYADRYLCVYKYVRMHVHTYTNIIYGLICIYKNIVKTCIHTRNIRWYIYIMYVYECLNENTHNQ